MSPEPNNSESSPTLVQLFREALAFVADIADSLEKRDIPAAMLRVGIICMVLLFSIIFGVLASVWGGNPENKTDLIFSLAVLLFAVFFLMIIVFCIFPPKDRDLARKQASRAQRISPTPIT